MSNTILYGFTKQDLERTVEFVVKRVLKTETINTTSFGDTNDLLTQKEAAELFGKTVQCLINWKKQKLIPYYEIGSSVFYSKKELLECARKNPKLVSAARK
ncbi:helix-turn-helix domain-containing protein [uncultured Zobellia sp.]|uniref:helix-turn-helix domain-containing protein n=1 Tax=uncultured Zobellia sp. TaxID=255433 RepID=UPI00259AAE94|nr:helix-turn-helix domain-containing protein [uncultured Zobellia sp.]